jgi:hypothetical protein
MKLQSFSTIAMITSLTLIAAGYLINNAYAQEGATATADGSMKFIGAIIILGQS